MFFDYISKIDFKNKNIYIILIHYKNIFKYNFYDPLALVNKKIIFTAVVVDQQATAFQYR